MKLRKARKKTRPTQHHVFPPLFPYEMRQQRLKQAVAEVNALVEVATQILEQFNKGHDRVFGKEESNEN